MNTTLEPYLKKLLDGGMKTAEEAVNFIEMQAPQLMHETIVWGAVSEMIAPLIGLLLVGLAIIFHKFLSKWGTNGYYESDEFPAVILTALFSFAGLTIFCCQIMDVLYPLIAPRVFLLEKISALIK
jgi:hypothetical protein